MLAVAGSLLAAGAVFAAIQPGLGEDRPVHPAAGDLPPELADRVNAVQGDPGYRDVRAAYVSCMQAEYPDFSGTPGRAVTLRDGTTWPPEGGSALSAAGHAFLLAAEDCQRESGYTALLDSHGHQTRALAAGEPSEQTRFLWECITAAGIELAPPAGNAIPLPLDDPAAGEASRACFQRWLAEQG